MSDDFLMQGIKSRRERYAVRDDVAKGYIKDSQGFIPTDLNSCKIQTEAQRSGFGLERRSDGVSER